MTDPVGRVRGKYAITVGGKPTAPSVSTVLNVLNKPGLPWGAAKETALFAIHHRDEWEHLPVDDAYHRLRRHHKGVWDDKANRGTQVHDMALSWTRGESVDCPAELAPFLDAVERFYEDWQPNWVIAEQTVVYDADDSTAYAGTPDGIADLADGQRWLLDYKTGTDVWPEMALQLAAYRHATKIAHYSELGGLERLDPMIPVDACGLIHLHDDGSYHLRPVQAGRVEWDFFMWCRRLWVFTSQHEKKVLGPPARAPQREGAA